MGIINKFQKKMFKSIAIAAMVALASATEPSTELNGRMLQDDTEVAVTTTESQDS